MEVFEIIGLLIAGAAGLINYIQNRRRRELAEELPEEGDEEFFPFPEDVLMETDEALESIGQEIVESIPMDGQDASPLEEMAPQGSARGQDHAPESSILTAPIMMTRPKKGSTSRLATKKRARQAIIDAEIFAPPISKRQKGPFTPLSRPV